VTEWAVAPIPDAAPPADPSGSFAPAGSASALATDPARPASDRAPSAGVAQFAIDEDPEEAASETARLRTATLAPVREGDVLPQGDIEPSIRSDDADEDDLETGASADAPVPPSIAPPLTAAPPRTAQPRVGAARPVAPGVQRYGEAVVRQMLGATFIREEPYEPPTRFS
jgi:DNA polymerase-3 subunit gamma/tau